jgi:hypothetical protein
MQFAPRQQKFDKTSHRQDEAAHEKREKRFTINSNT